MSDPYAKNTGIHKYLADPKSCDQCHGRGWYPDAVAGTENDYIPDMMERYCTCVAGERRSGFDAPAVPKTIRFDEIHLLDEEGRTVVVKSDSPAPEAPK